MQQGFKLLHLFLDGYKFTMDDSNLDLWYFINVFLGYSYIVANYGYKV